LTAEAKAKAEAEAKAAEERASQKAAAEKRFAELDAAEETYMEAMTAFWAADHEGTAELQLSCPSRALVSELTCFAFLRML